MSMSKRKGLIISELIRDYVYACEAVTVALQKRRDGTMEAADYLATFTERAVTQEALKSLGIDLGSGWFQMTDSVKKEYTDIRIDARRRAGGEA
jgi:hypothetical protein